MSSSAPSQGGFNSDAIRKGVFAEINDLKDTAKAFGIDAITDGSWFNEFFSSCLKGYHERVMKQGGEAYLRNKYPGLSTVAVAEELCQLAGQAAMMADQHAWHASLLAGSLLGAAASGDVVTAGVAIPDVMGEVLYTIRLQLRLVYDLHLLYGIPLNTSDPEDLMAIFAVAYGVKLAEGGEIGAKALGPEVMRAQLFRLIDGNTKAIQSAVRQVLGPKIARNVTQRSILKTTEPYRSWTRLKQSYFIRSIGFLHPIFRGWNYATATQLMGMRIQQEMRIKAGLREEAAYLHGKLSSNEQISLAVIEGLMTLAIADNEFTFDDLECEVYFSFLNQLGLNEEQLSKLASKIHADLEGVLKQLARVEDENSRVAIGRCFCLLAVSDGAVRVRSAKYDILLQLLGVIGIQRQQAYKLCVRFRDLELERFLHQDQAFSSEDFSSAVSRVKGELQGPLAELQEKEFKANAKEQQAQVFLQELAQLGDQLASGEISIETYQIRRGKLKAKISGITDDLAVPAGH